MKKNISGIIMALAFTLFFTGCISKQPVSIPSEGTYQGKIDRFNYMQTNWSYLDNDWITGQKVTPGMLHSNFMVGNKAASNDIMEFKKIQRHYSGFQRFMASIFLLNVQYYVNY